MSTYNMFLWRNKKNIYLIPTLIVTCVRRIRLCSYAAVLSLHSMHGVVGWCEGAVYLTSPGRPTDIGLQLGKACYPCSG